MRVGDSFCPGIVNAVPAKDGFLMRIRIPGGCLKAAQLNTVAKISSAFAGGHMEITSRANLQIRGLRPRHLTKVREQLAASGLLPSTAHDRVRNIVASPLTGLEKEELVDTRDMVRSLDAQLIAEPICETLPAKFSMALDGGGRWFSDETDDLALRAFRIAGKELWHLSIGGTSTGLVVTTEQAPNFLLQAAKECLRASERFAIPTRGSALARHRVAWASVVSELRRLALSCAPPISQRISADVPVGISEGRQNGSANIVPSIPLGRLSAAQALEIAALSARGNLDLRLAPWRGIVLGSVPKHALPEVLSALDALHLSTDASDGYVGIAACAGITGCEASLADVRADAAAVARALAGRARTSLWRVNIAGCEKQCAMRTPATVKLVAGQTGYSMSYEGTSIGAGFSSGHVIAAIASMAAGLPPEVSP